MKWPWQSNAKKAKKEKTMSRIAYHLPRTVLTVSGVVESRLVGKNRQVYETTLELEQAAEADPEDYYLLDLTTGWSSDVTASLTLTRDGMLTNAEHTSVGIGPKLVSAAATLGTVLVGTFAKGLLPSMPPDGAPTPNTYEQAHKALFECRESARKQLEALCKKRTETIESALTRGGDTGAAARTLKHLDRMEGALRSQIASVDTHEAAWLNTQSDPQFEPFSFTLRTADLIPIRDRTVQPSEPTTHPMKQVYDKTGRVVTIERTDPVVDGFETLDNENARSHRRESFEGIVYRHAYNATLRVHGYVEDANGGKEFRIEQEAEVRVIDDKSPVGALPLGGGFFSKGSLGVSFYESGELENVSNEATSAVGATADVLAGVPASVAAALETVETAGTRIDSLTSADRNQTLAKLETEKATLEARIATENLTVTADLQKEQARLQARIDLLTARSELGVAAARWLYGKDGNPPAVA